MDHYEDRIKLLEAELLSTKQELESTKQELESTKKHLKRYTAPAYKKEYYQNNKEAILEKSRLNPTPVEKRKEYNRIAYSRRKEKIEKEKENENTTI